MTVYQPEVRVEEPSSVGEWGLNEPLGPELVAIQLYCRGLGKTEIARRMNKSPRTIDHWIRSNPAAVREEVRRYSAVDYFLPHVPKAVETTVDVMETGAPGHRLLAAQTVLDEAFGKAVVRSEHKSHSVINITYSDQGDEPTLIEGMVVDGSDE